MDHRGDTGLRGDEEEGFLKMARTPDRCGEMKRLCRLLQESEKSNEEGQGKVAGWNDEQQAGQIFQDDEEADEQQRDTCRHNLGQGW